GADDVVTLDKQWQLTARLRALPSEPPPPPSRRAAGVIVADTDQGRRIVLGRVLRNAGYTVTFAVTGRAGLPFAQMPGQEPGVLGRVLRNAGYTVTFAVTGEDVVQFAQMPGQELVVLGPEIEGAPADIIEQARRAGSGVTFIVARAPRELKVMRSEIGQLPGV